MTVDPAVKQRPNRHRCLPGTGARGGRACAQRGDGLEGDRSCGAVRRAGDRPARVGDEAGTASSRPTRRARCRSRPNDWAVDPVVGTSGRRRCGRRLRRARRQRPALQQRRPGRHRRRPDGLPQGTSVGHRAALLHRRHGCPAGRADRLRADRPDGLLRHGVPGDDPVGGSAWCRPAGRADELALGETAGWNARGRGGHRDGSSYGEPDADRLLRSTWHRARPAVARGHHDHRRRRLAAARSAGPDGVAIAEVDLSATRDKRLSSRNDALGDRRPDIYDRDETSTTGPDR